jgi:hypothetical protein
MGGPTCAQHVCIHFLPPHQNLIRKIFIIFYDIGIEHKNKIGKKQKANKNNT